MHRFRRTSRVSSALRSTLLICALAPAAPLAAADWQSHAPLPVPLTNNAITSHVLDDTCFVYSFMGLDTTKIYSGISRLAFRLNTVSNSWEQLPDVPGSVGRIAALALTVRDSLYVIGGYSVGSGGGETTWETVNVFDPATWSWSLAAPVPVRVDDMVGGVWRDSLIYLVSGWSQNTTVQNVQVFDPATGAWSQATPLPISGTFGGAGGIVGDYIVFADGVSNAFILRNRTQVGLIDPGNPLSITWVGGGMHAGPGLYRMASGAVPAETRFLFAGGSDNPYNYNGIGYNGVPSEPVATVWSMSPATLAKLAHDDKPVATMDHRGLALCGGRLYAVGGMLAGRAVSGFTQSYAPDLITSAPEARPPSGAASVVSLRSSPNPARVEARFSTAASEREPFVLRDARVVDASGRRVRTFSSDALGAMTEFRWDLRGDSGARVAAGVYWLEGRVFDRTVRAKILVLD
ncbi:MAG: hypothetical protein ACKVU1_00605 [bacterium]